MAKFSILVGPVDHDGERYEEGAQITLSAEAAEELLSLGVIGALEASKAKSAPAES
jgi:hypothetical protein